MPKPERTKREEIERVNVRFPKELMGELRRYVPMRKRSEVIIAGTARILAELRQKEALRAGAGAWSDRNHPDLICQEDIDRFLVKVRASASRSRDYDNLSS